MTEYITPESIACRLGELSGIIDTRIECLEKLIRHYTNELKTLTGLRDHIKLKEYIGVVKNDLTALQSEADELIQKLDKLKTERDEADNSRDERNGSI